MSATLMYRPTSSGESLGAGRDTWDILCRFYGDNRSHILDRDDLDSLRAMSAAAVNAAPIDRMIEAIEKFRSIEVFLGISTSGCNRHENCAVAREEYKKAEGREPGPGFCCHDDCCEECFGN